MVKGCICSNLDSDGSEEGATQPTDPGDGCHQVAENPVDFPQFSWPCRHQQVLWFSASPVHWRGAGPGGNRVGSGPGENRVESAGAQTSWKTAHTGAGKEGVTLT